MSERNINFGCGENRIPGWECWDSDCDVTKTLPYDDNWADKILAEHLVEHLTGPEGFRFMRECHRILKPGGVLRICVPTLKDEMTNEHRADLILGHGHKMVYCRESLRMMLRTAGFIGVGATGFKECDGHHRIIGAFKDNLETLRMEGSK